LPGARDPPEHFGGWGVARHPGRLVLQPPGELCHRLAAVSHHQCVVLVGLGQNPAKAVIGLLPGTAAGAVDQEPGLHADALEPGGNGEVERRIVLLGWSYSGARVPTVIEDEGEPAGQDSYLQRLAQQFDPAYEG